MKARFDELLPWYVNGSLGPDDRAVVEQYLAEHPQAHAELDWYRSLQQRLQDAAPAVPETIGLDRVLARIGHDRPSLAARVGNFFSALLGTSGMRPATAFAGLAIIVVQAGFIFSLLGRPHEDEAEMRALRATVTDQRPMLKINFAPDAREADVRHALMSVHGRLVGGPGQLGDYFVVVPAGSEASAAQQLQSNPIVQAVSLAPGLPPRE
jgi:hypothetical protein